MIAAFVVPLLALAGEGRARWTCEPRTVEVGQPFELVLELEHGPGDPALRLFDGDPRLDGSWVLLGRHEVLELERHADSVRSRVGWSLASLEPGERDLSEALTGVAFDPVVTSISVGEARVDVRGVLAEGEDAPRGLRLFPPGFLDGADDGPRGTRWAWSLALVIPAVLAILLVVRRRGRRKVAAAPPSDLERLDELCRRAADDPAAGCYALTSLVREAADRTRGTRTVGLTDEEWLGEVRATRTVPAPTVEGLARVLERAGRIKYGGEGVTSWALDELFEQARNALRTLGPGSALDAGGRGAGGTA